MGLRLFKITLRPLEKEWLKLQDTARALNKSLNKTRDSFKNACFLHYWVMSKTKRLLLLKVTGTHWIRETRNRLL